MADADNTCKPTEDDRDAQREHDAWSALKAQEDRRRMDECADSLAKPFDDDEFDLYSGDDVSRLL